MADPTIRFLRELIAIDSVNPSLVSGGAGEKQIAEAIATAMRASGMDVEFMEVRPGRPNVVGVVEGSTQGRSLMFCGHVDTVGVAGMEAPFTPVEDGGRLYGRGAQDMKGGVAAMIGAATALARSGGLKSGRLIVAAVVDEEHESLGAEALVKDWHADGAIVTEPTDLAVAVGHRGFSWIEITTQGLAAHGSRPDVGRDAICRMGRVLSRLEKLDRRLQGRPAHQIQGTGSLHASLITGGRELSTYPDRCVLQIERRKTSVEPKKIALVEVEDILSELRSEDPDFQAHCKLIFDRSAFETPGHHELPSLLEDILRQMGHPARRSGVPFWTDAAVLASVGIPTVIFGPGGEGLHSLSEYVRTAEVLVCRDVLKALASTFCCQDFQKAEPKE